VLAEGVFAGEFVEGFLGVEGIELAVEVPKSKEPSAVAPVS
jgi:hypothetical protein